MKRKNVSNPSSAKGGGRELPLEDKSPFRIFPTLSESEWQRVGETLGLSTREVELVQHIFDGTKLSHAARLMQIAVGTVKTYSQRIHQKLHVCDQRELTLAVMWAYLNLQRDSRKARSDSGSFRSISDG